MDIEIIKEQLDNCIDLYTNLFCKKQECYASGWIGDIKGGVNCFSDAYINFEDIRRDLEKNVPSGVIFDWYWSNEHDTGRFINYNSYLMGLRITDLE